MPHYLTLLRALARVYLSIKNPVAVPASARVNDAELCVCVWVFLYLLSFKWFSINLFGVLEKRAGLIIDC